MPLIYPVRNPLAYPGGNPGFDPAHFAGGPRIRFSGVATGSGFSSILTGVKMPLVGAIVPMQSQIGPLVGTTVGSVNAYTQAPIQNDIAPSAFTTATILQYTGHNTNSWATYFSILSYNMGLDIVWYSMNNYGTNSSVPFSFSAGNPYFVVLTCISNTVRILLKNLNTGTLKTYIGTGPTILPDITSSYVYIGGGGPSTSALLGGVAAFMYSVNNPLTPIQLLQWAQDPWSFWYPQTVRQQIQNHNYVTAPSTDYTLKCSNLLLPNA